MKYLPLYLLALVIALLAIDRCYNRTAGEHAAQVARLEDVAYRATRNAAAARREAAERLREYEAAQRQTDAALAAARRRIQSAATFQPMPVAVDSAPHIVMGHPVPTDTLIPLSLARQKVGELADSANTIIGTLASVIEVERGRASLAIQSFQRTIAAQDTALAAKDSVIRVLRASRPGWLHRLVGGLESAAGGGLCALLAYPVAGPLGAAGIGVACGGIVAIIR